MRLLNVEGAELHGYSDFVSGTGIIGMVIRVTWALLLWYSVEVSELEYVESKNVPQLHGRSDQESELIIAVWDEVKSVPIPPLMKAVARGQNVLSNFSAF